MKKKVGVILIIVMIFLQLNARVYAQQSKKDNTKMSWWKAAKFGMFIHWGLYSIPAGNWKSEKTPLGSGAEWIQCLLKIPVSDYKSLAAQFNPTRFNAEQYVKLAKEAGMKYIVLTAKHHEGFAMFKSKDPFNIVDATPYKMDIVKAMAIACKKYGMHFGLYYSQAQDWNHKGGSECNGSWDSAQNGNFDQYLDSIAIPQVKEILSGYNPEIIWWDTPCKMTKENAAKFAPILANYPNLITNDRLGGNVAGDLETPEQHIPATGIPGKNWESCMTMNDTWGYSSNDSNWKETSILIRNLIDIASKGGNYLLNVGPTSEGLLPQTSINRLKELGNWMKMNSEAIYGTSASPFSDINWGRVTQIKHENITKLYLNVFNWPTDGRLTINGLTNKIRKAYPLINKKRILKIGANDSERFVYVDNVKQTDYATVIVLEIVGTPNVNKKPEIKSAHSVFIDKIEFEITTETKNGVVYFTTDGTKPTTNSQVANGKIILNSIGNLLVKAQTFVNGKPATDITEKEFFKANPLPSICEPKIGLNYKYYEGAWNFLPDFSKITPVKSGVTENFTLNERKRETNYGFVFDGYINIPKTDVYSFFLSSDDGSKMAIDDQIGLDNDGKHGIQEKNMEMALSAGLHRISLQFFQGGGGDFLSLEWQASGMMRTPIDNSILVH